MTNLIETIDIQRSIRKAAYKKAAQLYSGKNVARGWDAKPNENQIRGIFRIAYGKLQRAHPRMEWLKFEHIPSWISKLDYYAARGGKPILHEILQIIENIGGKQITQPVLRITKHVEVIPPEPPMPDYPNEYLPPQPAQIKQSKASDDPKFMKMLDDACEFMEKEGIKYEKRLY